jgi:hypothetical protein
MRNLEPLPLGIPMLQHEQSQVEHAAHLRGRRIGP